MSMQSVFYFINFYFFLLFFCMHFYIRAPLFLRIQAIREIRKY